MIKYKIGDLVYLKPYEFIKKHCDKTGIDSSLKKYCDNRILVKICNIEHQFVQIRTPTVAWWLQKENIEPKIQNFKKLVK